MKVLDKQMVNAPLLRQINKRADGGDILYIELQKNRTDSWLSALGLQLPVGLTKYGSIGKVIYYTNIVKDQDNEQSNEKAVKNTDEPRGMLLTTVEEQSSRIFIYRVSAQICMANDNTR